MQPSKTLTGHRVNNLIMILVGNPIRDGANSASKIGALHSAIKILTINTLTELAFTGS